MAKITTIIDIGSNSMRMVVLKKTSRFGFHLINESRSKVKISEGCYQHGGNLQELPMQRAYDTLKSFLNISKALKSRKILCVATSALRDAPNKSIFLSRVKKELDLNIKVIDGSKEAYYGGVAALNLSHCDDFFTVDIGGGSTEFTIVKNRKIVDYISLDIGTVRLKELFFDKNDIEGAKEYILQNLKKVPLLPNEIKKVVGIGGSIRNFSKIFMENKRYPLDVLHGFEYKYCEHKEYFSNIIDANSDSELRRLGVKKDRFDTIKEGAFIFDNILSYFDVDSVVTSGVGVREGVYLCDLLRNQQDMFPANFNLSVRIFIDRFELDSKMTAYLGNNASKIFYALQPLHNLDEKYNSLLVVASKLYSIGTSLNFYKYSENSFDFILNGLNYGFSHEDKVLIAHMIKYSTNYLPNYEDLSFYKELLPDTWVVQWLSFMLTLNVVLDSDFAKRKYEYNLDKNELSIKNEDISYYVKEQIEKIELPIGIKLKIE
ncbi:MAG: Ppx/GppA family phosphatase [Arcobacter butzleri]|jgi:exopolyphosphatase/guanosine-5'-triphosphate,3'-diphosphate pyrophosphatase|nr:Ppx/GppA family phosphatase [Arcobacteraceae bacterium]MDY0365468.1 Ppx/GppA phosphatase family protein [Arcobacteraceae bacterium]NLO17472.1 Ppx/GppA family phosphatase [Aliarcobacter butzleri]